MAMTLLYLQMKSFLFLFAVRFQLEGKTVLLEPSIQSQHITANCEREKIGLNIYLKIASKTMQYLDRPGSWTVLKI